MSYWNQKPQNPTGKSVLQLITAIKHLSWEDVEDRLAKYPDEAKQTDKFGLASLHHAIRKRHCHVPLNIISALIAAYPPSLELCDDQTGCNALHVACKNSSEETCNSIFSMVLDAYPDGSRQLCKDGRIPLHRATNVFIATKLIEVYPLGLGIASKSCKHLPLHDACSDNAVPPEVIKLLIEHGRKEHIGIDCSNDASYANYCGGVLVEDIYSDLPLKILFRRIMFSSKSNGQGLAIDEGSPIWAKLCIVAKATYQALCNFPPGWDSRPAPLVHAIIECGGHPNIVKHALKLNPDEIAHRDSKGRTPLSIASEKVNILPEIIDLLLNSEECGDASAARIANNNRRLPLHLAVESGRTLNNGVESILRAEPLALQTRDMETRLYPFQLAAIPTFGWDNSNIDTIYSLLFAAPNVIDTYCTDDSA